MKASAIDTEIQKINAEIATLEAVRDRLEAVRNNNGTEDAPKAKRTRKRRIGLAAQPPASEANLLGKL